MLLNLNQHASKKYCQPLVHVAIHRDRSLFPWKDCPNLSKFLWTICPRRTRSIPNEKVCFPHRHAYQRVQGFSCMERALCVMQNKDCSYTPSFYNIPLFVLFFQCSLAFYLFHSVYFFICFTTARFLVRWKCHSFLTDLSTAAAVLFVPSFVPKPFPQRQLMIQSDQRFVWPKHLRAVFLYFHTLAQNSFSLLSLPVLLPTCLPVVNLLLLTSFSHPTHWNVVCAHHTLHHWIGNWSFIRTSLRYVQVIFCYCFQMSSSE